MDCLTEQLPRHETTRLLLLDDATTTVQFLSSVLQTDLPQLTLEPCSSPGHAQLLLTRYKYQAVISTPSLTVVDGRSLLTLSRHVHPPVPFLLTLGRGELQFGQSWLDYGVYDLIFSPLEPSQAIESI